MEMVDSKSNDNIQDLKNDSPLLLQKFWPISSLGNNIYNFDEENESFLNKEHMIQYWERIKGDRIRELSVSYHYFLRVLTYKPLIFFHLICWFFSSYDL